MNLFCLVGQVTGKPEMKETQSGVKVTTFDLKVQRQFPCSEGYYEYDIIKIETWRGVAETLFNIATENMWLSTKGRISTRPYEKDGKTYQNPVFIADTVKYLR